jgi:hypothetical protein
LLANKFFNYGLAISKIKNMNKIIKGCVLSIMLVVFYSCANDKKDEAKLITELVETFEDSSTLTTTFTYKDDQIVSSDNAAEHVEYTYTNGLITKIVRTNKSDQTQVSSSFTYDSEKLFEVQSSDESFTKYVHNTDGSVSYDHFVMNDKQVQIKQFHGVLSFENGNLVKDNRVLDAAESGLITKIVRSFDYDSSINPYHNIQGFDKLLDQNELVSANNSLLCVVENSTINNVDDQAISSAKMHKSSFKYDSDGYPTEQVIENAKANLGYLKTEYIYK